MILQVAVNSFGSTTVAAYTAASKVEQLVVQPGIALGMTMATYSAQNLGAHQIERIRLGVRKCTWITLIVNALSGVLVVLLGSYIVQLFIPAENIEALPLSQQYLNTVAIFFPILGLLFLFHVLHSSFISSKEHILNSLYTNLRPLLLFPFLSSYTGLDISAELI